MLVQGWQEASRRVGSFADAPCELGADIHATMAPVAPLEQAAHRAVLDWVGGISLPPMPPAANRYAEVQLYGALGFVRALAKSARPSATAGLDGYPSATLAALRRARRHGSASTGHDEERFAGW